MAPTEAITEPMVKRSRIRPGQRRPTQRTSRPVTSPTASTPAASTAEPPKAGLTSQEEQRAAEIEAQIVAQERAVEETRARERRRASDTAIYSSQPLAARAAEEYGYVTRDLRRIVVVGGSLLAALGVLFVISNLS